MGEASLNSLSKGKMKKLFLLALCTVPLFFVACHNQADPKVNEIKYERETGTVISSHVSLIVNMLKDTLPPRYKEHSIDTMMGKGGMPDFTDDGLSWLMSNGGNPQAQTVTNCVIPNLTSMFTASSNWPGSFFTFNAPNIYAPIVPQCLGSSYVPWIMSDNQRYAWKCTSPAVRNLIISYLNMYVSAITPAPATPIFCSVSGLDFGGINYNKYIGAMLNIYIDSGSGQPILYEIVLTRGGPGPICP